MHPSVYVFVGSSIFRAFSQGKRVLEIGSRDVNGSVREFFAGCDDYVGLDIAEGKGVDVVCDANSYDGKDVFDIVVCTEVLEHVREPKQIIDCAYRALKVGGMFILTCAGPGRHEHSGTDASWEVAPGEHYRNIEPDELRVYLEGWEFSIDFLEASSDLRAVAFKRSKLSDG